MVSPGEGEGEHQSWEMDGLCQPRHESHRNDERWSQWQNWLDENCVCRSDPTTKWEQLEEEEEEEVFVPALNFGELKSHQFSQLNVTP